MLQFITTKSVGCLCPASFNTSHVVVYRVSATYAFASFCGFNTSHVVVYLSEVKQKKSFFLRFNTSHVVVYHAENVPLRTSTPVSIHLMLQFIPAVPPSGRSVPEFQYISCCSLSKTVPHFITAHSSFNTSHVVVYPGRSSFRQVSTRVSIHLMLQFIPDGMEIVFDKYSFNTSHVVVYLTLIINIRRFYYGFNTSHVVVYLILLCMLVGERMFQYISCCSLSWNSRFWEIFACGCFNTSHVVVYPGI